MPGRAIVCQKGQGEKCFARRAKVTDDVLVGRSLLLSFPPNSVLFILLSRISDAISGRKRDKMGTCVFNSTWLGDDEFKQWVQRSTSDTEFNSVVDCVTRATVLATWVQGPSVCTKRET